VETRFETDVNQPRKFDFELSTQRTYHIAQAKKLIRL